ncbi:hypothetical protein LTR53_016471 [Teratosphaeriaceae sp. CCFEE 6253]|nr:hypothetical protein LTR53_016471 [Teratosphaeriaceae sp. CCFEE 6253]
MLPPGLRSTREVNLYYDQVYFDLINTNHAHPFLYPWASVGAAVVLLYLLIDHRQSPWLKWLRWPIFGFLVTFQGWCIATHRARSPAAALGVGLISSWGTLWVAAIMLVNDCQMEFRRIERGPVDDVRADGEPEANGSATNGSPQHQTTGPGLRRRVVASSRVDSSPAKPSSRYDDRLYWQSYPTSPFTARLEWVADVFCSFRGVGWNWQISGIPPPPKRVQAALERDEGHGTDRGGDRDNQEPTTSRTGIRRYANRTALLRHVAVSLTLGYAALDIITALMHRDPYFWGYVDSPAPAYLPPLLTRSPALTQLYRLLLSLAGIHTALWTIFKLGPACFCGVLGPRWLGVRGEPWMNPADQFGAYEMVLTKGLAGWWGGWWHQTFRFAFEAPGTRLLDAVGVDRHSALGKAVGVFIAFFLSGCLHASGSYTQLGDTRPLRGPFRFFMLQAAGTLAQTTATQLLVRWGVVERCPKLLRYATNFALVNLWLYFTAPLLMDDFAKGGVWLFEPIPFSPLRGLGLGGPDDQFFTWWHGLVWWRSGRHWWDTGIAL